MNEDEKIILGFQNWSEEYQWWVPNSTPADFMVDGVKQLPVTHGIHWVKNGGGDLLLSATFSNAMLSTYFANTGESLSQRQETIFKHLPTIMGKKYIFPIFIRRVQFFKDYKGTGFDLIDKQVVKDVQEGRCKIVLVMDLEGTSGTENHFDFDILNSWCIKHNLNTSQVYYIHGNLIGKELCKGMNFTYIPINFFLTQVPDFDQHHSPFNPIDNKNLFLNYNRQPRRQRMIMLCELIRANLLNRGLVSYGGTDKNIANLMTQYNLPELRSAGEILDKLIPIELDMDLHLNNPAHNVINEHYCRTFLSLVAETLVCNNTIFFSEKTWKTIAVGHPFMMLGSKGTLSKLKELGYQTYGAWWDESYDNMDNLVDRIRCIVNELKRLSQYSPEELITMRTLIQPIVEHNQKLFIEQYLEATNEKCLLTLIKGIWDSF